MLFLILWYLKHVNYVLWSLVGVWFHHPYCVYWVYSLFSALHLGKEVALQGLAGSSGGCSQLLIGQIMKVWGGLSSAFLPRMAGMAPFVVSELPHSSKGSRCSASSAVVSDSSLSFKLVMVQPLRCSRVGWVLPLLRAVVHNLSNIVTLHPQAVPIPNPSLFPLLLQLSVAT